MQDHEYNLLSRVDDTSRPGRVLKIPRDVMDFAWICMVNKINGERIEKEKKKKGEENPYVHELAIADSYEKLFLTAPELAGKYHPKLQTCIFDKIRNYLDPPKEEENS